MFGRARAPVTFRLVVVALVIVMLVPLAVVKVRPARLVTPVMLRFVEVTEPKVTKPEALKLVEVRLVSEALPSEVLPVMVRLVPAMLVEVRDVPFDLVNDWLVEVRLPMVALPEADKLVEVIPPVTLMFVPVSEVTEPLVEVRLVKIPVEGVVAPIGVLSIVPALIVRLFTTMASVTELPGKLRAPETARLVVVAPVNVEFAKLVFVVKVIAPFEKAMSGVPVTEF